jgi:hypothetical protein
MGLLPQGVAISGGERRSDWSKYTANCLLIQIQKIIKIWYCVKEKITDVTIGFISSQYSVVRDSIQIE